MNKKTNCVQLALDLRRGVWFIKADDDLLSVVNGFLSKSPGMDFTDEPLRITDYSLKGQSSSGSGKEKERCVCVLPIHTSLTKYDTCETYGSMTMAEEISRLAGKPGVVALVLDIDSPGGSANAVSPLIEAIGRFKAAGKPIVAHCDSCFSAAYWIASQCDAVFCDNRLSELGSIGAYCVLEKGDNDGKMVAVYAKESPDKNLAYREALDGKPEKLQERLSFLVKNFQDAVKAGRPNLKADAPGVMTGGDFFAGDAIAVGLADGFATLEQAAEQAGIMADLRQ